MLNFTETRQQDLTAIYMPNMDLTLIEQQLREMSSEIDQAFADGNASLAIQDPTLSKMGGLIASFSNMSLTWAAVARLVTSVQYDLQIRENHIEIASTPMAIGFVIERYRQSAYISMTVHDVATLPA